MKLQQSRRGLNPALGAQLDAPRRAPAKLSRRAGKFSQRAKLSRRAGHVALGSLFGAPRHEHSMTPSLMSAHVVNGAVHMKGERQPQVCPPKHSGKSGKHE